MSIINAIKNKTLNYFPAFRHRNFRLFWSGMSLSLIGTWMQNISLPWLAYSITDSPMLLSLVGTLQFLPIMLFSLFAGEALDRLPKKTVLAITQALSMFIALLFALLIWTGHIKYWHILVLASILGLVNTFDMPGRQSYLIELVGKKDLMNAIALNSSVFNAARIVGPALAGMLMGYFGVAFCFLANAISFLPILIALFRIDADPVIGSSRKDTNVLKNIGEGLKHIYINATLVKTFLSLLVVSTFAMNFSVLIPVFAKNVLGQGETGFGFLMSSMGIGSFIGALLLAFTSKNEPNQKMLLLNPYIISVLLILTGFTSAFHSTTLLLAVTGFSTVTFNATSNSNIQINTRDEYRGRVMSVYTLAMGGSTPIGNLFTGYVTDRFGPQIAFIVNGAVVILFLLIILMLKRKNRVETSPQVE